MSKKQLQDRIAKKADRIVSRGAGKGILARVEQRYVSAPPGMTENLDGAAKRVKLDYIRPDPLNPRKTVNRNGLKELAESIKAHGVLQPVVVTYDEKEQAYYLVTGHRRYEAAKLAGVPSIPAIIQPSDYDEKQRLTHQLTENLQRENIPPIEEAQGIQTMMEALSLGVRQAAKRLGKAPSYVAESVGILRIPTDKLERAAALSKKALIEISKAKTESDQEHLLTTALGSEKPWKDTKKARKDKSPSFERFRYTLDRYEGARVTVEVPEGLAVPPHELLKAAARQARKG